MGVLDLIPTSIPYPIRGGIIRAVRTGIAIILGGVAASIADGSIIKEINFIPAAYTPAVLLFLSSTFVGVDKWLRERGLVAEAAEAALDVPLTEETSVVSVPAPAVNVTDDGVDPVIFADPAGDNLG